MVEKKPAPTQMPPVVPAPVPSPLIERAPEQGGRPDSSLPEAPVRKKKTEKRDVTVRKAPLPLPPPAGKSPMIPETEAPETLSADPEDAFAPAKPAGEPPLPAETPPLSAENPASATHSAGHPNPGISAIATPGETISDAKPRYKNNPRPGYPDIARKRNAQGTVVILALVNEKGSVEEAWVESSSGHVILDNAAISAVKSWDFEPGRHGDHPVKSHVILPITFQLK
jgi:protein TonB